MSLIDDTAKSYGSVPANKRLETKECWQNFNFRWKTTGCASAIGEFQTLKGEASIVYVGTHDELQVQELYSTTLPSNKHQTIQWSTFRPANPNAYILAYTLSIEENNLLACAN